MELRETLEKAVGFVVWDGRAEDTRKGRTSSELLEKLNKDLLLLRKGKKRKDEEHGIVNGTSSRRGEKRGSGRESEESEKGKVRML